MDKPIGKKRMVEGDFYRMGDRRDYPRRETKPNSDGFKWIGRPKIETKPVKDKAYYEKMKKFMPKYEKIGLPKRRVPKMQQVNNTSLKTDLPGPTLNTRDLPRFVNKRK